MNIDIVAPAAPPAAGRSANASTGSGAGANFADALSAASPAAHSRRDGAIDPSDRDRSADARRTRDDDGGARSGDMDRPNRGAGHAQGLGQGRGGVHGRAMALAQARAQAELRQRRIEAASAAAAAKTAGGEPPADVARVEDGKRRGAAAVTDASAAEAAAAASTITQAAAYAGAYAGADAGADADADADASAGAAAATGELIPSEPGTIAGKAGRHGATSGVPALAGDTGDIAAPAVTPKPPRSGLDAVTGTQAERALPRDTAGATTPSDALPVDPEAAASAQAALAAAAGAAPLPGTAAARATGARGAAASTGAAGLRGADAADGRTTPAGDPARAGTAPVTLDTDELTRAIGGRLRHASPERGAEPPAPPAAGFAASLQAAGQAAGPPTQTSAPAPAASYPITVPFSDPRFGDALSERVTWLIREGLQTAELTLHPKELGPIRIELTLDGDAASIGFSATQADTRAAIEQALPKLRDMLAGQGLQLGGALIDAGAGQRGNGDAPRARAGRGDNREPSGSAPAADGVAAAPRAVPSGRVDVFV